jgi:alkylated DNA repair protein (DNA oxidative demethylase)
VTVRRGPDLRGLRYTPGFVRPEEREALLRWLTGVQPLWELRFSEHRPPPAGETQRPLLRPVYWLGTWQFACLGYYHPPKGTLHRAIAAEPFPEPLASWVRRIERSVRTTFPPAFVPDGWCLNTCLVNFYGQAVADGRSEDRARVGDHRDFEPGPVASVSVGARAWFQFVNRQGRPVHERWLDDASLLLFAGPTWKDQTFHRVQRVDRHGEPLPPAIPGFSTRRVNFTFRWVPAEHVGTWATLPDEARRDVEGYVRTLAQGSPFWADALAGA